MSEYGEVLDTFEPDRDNMYKAFDDYFNHPIMFKIKSQAWLDKLKEYCKDDETLFNKLA
jgi:Holliday junction resolvase RusA-like endonuclease